jgi:glycerophosphoryl diester phosphodiesterase
MNHPETEIDIIKAACEAMKGAKPPSHVMIAATGGDGKTGLLTITMEDFRELIALQNRATAIAEKYNTTTEKIAQHMNHPESELQQACVKWFRLQYPQYAKLLFAIPNGGKRNAFEAARLKAEGVVAGVPDLMLAVVTAYQIGIFIEMKSPGEKPTAKQLEIQYLLMYQGYQVAICRSFDEFKETIENYLNR